MYLLCKEFIAVHSGSDGVTTFENVGHTVGQIVFTGQIYFVSANSYMVPNIIKPESRKIKIRQMWKCI